MCCHPKRSKVNSPSARWCTPAINRFTACSSSDWANAQKFEATHLARYAGAAVRYLGRRNVDAIALALPDEAKGNETACASFVAEGAISGTFETTIYQEKPEKRMAIESATILANGFDSKAVKAGVERGTILGEAVNFARRLAITPANEMTPTILADEAKKGAQAAGIEIEVFDEERIRKEGMGSFLSVAQGSVQPPKFIVMRYNGDPGSKELLALVGKGITFDTGGISLKPPERMEEMKYDMSRRRSGHRDDGRPRQTQAQTQRRRLGSRDGKYARRQSDEAGRHRQSHERQDDRSDQHRCRRPVDSGRRAGLCQQTRRNQDHRRRDADRRVRDRARSCRQRCGRHQRRVHQRVSRGRKTNRRTVLADAALR